jgi:hypothetical protein
VLTWSPEDTKTLVDYQTELVAELTDTGEMVGGEGLAPPTSARIVRATSPDSPTVTDAFPETKEFLVAFGIIEVDTLERAVELAAAASAAPGPGGEPLRIPIEIRPIGEPPQV